MAHAEERIGSLESFKDDTLLYRGRRELKEDERHKAIDAFLADIKTQLTLAKGGLGMLAFLGTCIVSALTLLNMFWDKIFGG